MPLFVIHCPIFIQGIPAFLSLHVYPHDSNVQSRVWLVWLRGDSSHDLVPIVRISQDSALITWDIRIRCSLPGTLAQVLPATLPLMWERNLLHLKTKCVSDRHFPVRIREVLKSVSHVVKDICQEFSNPAKLIYPYSIFQDISYILKHIRIKSNQDLYFRRILLSTLGNNALGS